MYSQSLIHDGAMKLASEALGIVAPCLREEEQEEAFGLFYDAARKALLSHEEKLGLLIRRLRPHVKGDQ